MKLSDITILFLIIHVVADFYLLSIGLGAEKESKDKAFAWHTVVYATVMLLSALALTLIQGDPRMMWAGLTLSSLHAAAALLKYIISKTKRMEKPNAQAWLYLSDQLLLILCAVFITNRFTAALPIPGLTLRWILLLSLIHKPANVSFKNLFSKYESAEGKAAGGQANGDKVTEGKADGDKAAGDPGKPDTLPGAGAVIGSLERVLCAIFIGLGQYASIGLIYTAKSIARFKKIEENPKFAEYYLIGTLYSILFVVACYLLVVETL